jgi:uncharacterized membrane protein YeaQ/YmgE (transglycosylase-associated protein family)
MYKTLNYLIVVILISCTMGFVSDMVIARNEGYGIVVMGILMIAGVIFGMKLIEVIQEKEEFQCKVISVNEFLKLMGYVFGSNPK